MLVVLYGTKLLHNNIYYVYSIDPTFFYITKTTVFCLKKPSSGHTHFLKT